MMASITVTGCRLVLRDRIRGDRTCASSWLATRNTRAARTAASGLTVKPSRMAGVTPRMGPRYGTRLNTAARKLMAVARGMPMMLSPAQIITPRSMVMKS